MKVNQRAILNKAKERDRDGMRVSLYLNRERYEKFKAHCSKNGVKMSSIIEELIKSYLE